MKRWLTILLLGLGMASAAAQETRSTPPPGTACSQPSCQQAAPKSAAIRRVRVPLASVAVVTSDPIRAPVEELFFEPTLLSPPKLQERKKIYAHSSHFRCKGITLLHLAGEHLTLNLEKQLLLLPAADRRYGLTLRWNPGGHGD